MQLSTKVVTSVLLLALLLLLSCSDSKTASNATFRAAVQATLDQEPSFLGVYNSLFDIADFKGHHHADARLDALVNVGIMSKTLGMVHESQHTAFILGHNPGTVPGVHYELTLQGRRYERVRTNGISSVRDIAYADKQLVQIVRFTEPAAASGRTMSEVTYTYKLVHVAEWANNAQVRQLYHLDLDDQPRPAKIVLTLMSDGWQAER